MAEGPSRAYWYCNYYHDYYHYYHYDDYYHYHHHHQCQQHSSLRRLSVLFLPLGLGQGSFKIYTSRLCDE